MTDRYYVLSSMKKTGLDKIVIGPATVPGTYWGAFARVKLEVDDVAGMYTGATHRARSFIVQPSDPPSDGSYRLLRTRNGKHYQADAYQVDSCHARGANEALTEAEENCQLTLDGQNRLCLVATRTILPGEPLLTRYGFRYWMHLKWPLPLLEAMFRKYTAIVSTRPSSTTTDESDEQGTITTEQVQQWQLIIDKKRKEQQARRALRPPSILRLPTPDQPTHPVRRPLLSHPTPQERLLQKKRKLAQKEHRLAVREGTVPPKRSLPTKSTPAPYHPDFICSDWIANPSPTVPAAANFCTMSWSCFAALCPARRHSDIPTFLRRVAELITRFSVDCMWLQDTRHLPGDLEQYLPALRKALPNSRIFQFATHRVKTGSRTEMNNRMGGAIAIISYRWAGWTLAENTYTDPMGLGIVNSLDFRVGEYKICSVNAYFPPTQGGTGPATIHSSCSRHQHRPNMPCHVKRQTPNEYCRSLAQARISSRRLEGYTVVLTGDLNDAPTTHSFKVFKEANALANPIHEAFHHDPSFHTRFSNSERMQNSAIDHAMHTPLPHNMAIQQVGVCNVKQQLKLSIYGDHFPIWLNLKLTTPITMVQKSKPLPTHPRCELGALTEAVRQAQEGDNWDEHVTYNKLILAQIRRFPRRSLRDHGGCLAALLRLSVEVVETGKGLNKKRKSKPRGRVGRIQQKRKNGFSPAATAIAAHLQYYVKLSSLAFPPGRPPNPRWTATTYQDTLTHCSKQWNRRHQHLLLQTQHHHVVARLESPTHLEYLNFHQITYDLLARRIRKLKGLVHGSQRDRLRLATNDRIRQLEQLRENKDLRRLIEILSGRPRDQLDLNALPSDTEGLIIDHYRIQQKLNEYFADWHSIPKTLDPAADHLAKHPLFWQSLLIPRATPKILTRHSRIPQDLQMGLRKNCEKKVSAETEAKVLAAENKPITFEDFNNALKDLVNGGAPGPSNATANMIKGWNTEVRQFAYEHMQALWEMRAVPLWWKDKKVKLAPKIPGNSQLQNMRPISLYEIIRKVWTTTIAKRIHQVLHEANAIHSSQGGYRLDQGTMMPLLRVINQIEGAVKTNTAKHITFWDIRRAFDSIPRNLQMLAWMRMGVSKNVAQWFIEQDDGGLSTLDTPLYANNCALHSHTEMLRGKKHMSAVADTEDYSFQAERGIGQGESASSLQWTVLYDMVLEWIDPRNRHLHVNEDNQAYSDRTAQDAVPFAYADDLATCASGPQAEYLQQLQATWLSAFCAFSGLTIHPGKIKATIVGPIHPRHQPRKTATGITYMPSTLIVHDHQWEPISCPIDPTMLTYKYLGVQLDLRCCNSDSFDREKEKAGAMLSHLLLQPASLRDKIEYIRFKILPIVLYTAQVSNWSLEQYRSLDVPFTQTYRKLLALPRTSPNTIIYLPTQYCGIGLPRVSDLAQKYKWNNLLRCQALGGENEKCMNQLLDRIPSERHPRQTPIRVIHPHHVTQDGKTRAFKKGARYTARSLLEWTKQSGLSISSRVYEDSQMARDRLHNAITIEKHAKAAELWPDPEIYGDDQDLRDVKLYVTDGSFIVSTEGAKDIITPEQELRRKGRGSGGIAIMPRNPRHPVLGFHVRAATAQPGMNAYSWELLTQLVGLNIMKYLPHSVTAHSDCMSAIKRSNAAMMAFINKSSHEKGGILISGAHQFRPAEAGHPDPHMRRADPGLPRLIEWLRAHPELDLERAKNPNQYDFGMYLADAFAASASSRIKPLGRNRMPATQIETLELSNIINEIIPKFQWHLRSVNAPAQPIFDDPADYQHRAQLNQMTSKRDKENNEHRWSTTALEFTASVHKPQNKSYWAAARRALIVFDWMGHGRNRAKLTSLSPTQQQHEAKCRQCGMPDSQQHLLLECSHAPLNAIRCDGRASQLIVAQKLLKTHQKSANLTHFIRQFIDHSWNPRTMELTRFWFGTWSLNTLQSLLQQNLNTPMSLPVRAQYIKTTRQLTKPLLDAYQLLLKAVISACPNGSSSEDHLPLLDHFPTDNHSQNNTLHSSHPLILSQAMPSLLRQEIEAMHIQEPDCARNSPYRSPNLTCSATLSPFTEFTLADAAILRDGADGTL